MRGLPDDKIRERKQQDVAEQKWPLGNSPIYRIVHACKFRGIAGQAQANALLSARLTARPPQIIQCVRTCVIFNPAARGNKARHFRRQLDAIGSQCALKATAAPGDARRLAAEAVGEGFDLIVAAGGDGTVNETVNGLGDAPDGFARTRLGVLPLGTVNVFARELGLPLHIDRAWEILQQGHETRIDLPRVEFLEQGVRRRQYFVQLAGAGFDARAIELVHWSLKKKIGPLAYIFAGLKVLCEKKPKIVLHVNGQCLAGELILIGNGRFYGGPFAIFPQADLRDGSLDVCILQQVNWPTLFRCISSLLVRQKLPSGLVQRFHTANFELAGDISAPFELDGEWIGHLPVTFFVERERLRVVAP
jgi:YegS/Rv2252/BmrU family lipid kinase